MLVDKADMYEISVGQQVMFIGSSGDEALHDITYGEIYEVAGIDEDGNAYVIDDAGDKNFAVDFYGNGIYQIVNKYFD